MKREFSRDVVDLAISRPRKFKDVAICVVYNVTYELLDERGEMTRMETVRETGEPITREDAERLGILAVWDCYERLEGAVRQTFVEADERLRAELKAKKEPAQEQDRKTVYIVEFIEVEFGERPQGYRCFASYADAEVRARNVMADQVEGHYYGPRKPLRIMAIPLDALPPAAQHKLLRTGVAHTDDSWHPPAHLLRAAE